jgi:hypothetical protein
VLSFLLAPPLAVAATNAATTHLQAMADAEAADRSRTSAVLLEDAPPPERGSTGYGEYTVASVPVRVVWSVPGGTSREGTVLVRPSTPAGTAVPVWVDREGNLTRAPLDPDDIPSSAAMLGVAPLIGLPLATWTLYAVLSFTLDARRERRWERDWAAVEPDWHSRLL